MRYVSTPRNEAPTVSARKPGTSRGDWIMSAKHRILITGAVAVALTSCMDFLGTGSDNTLELPMAFQSVPAGFSSNSNSFDPSGDMGPFFPGAMDGGVRGGPDGGNSGPGGGDHKGEGEHRDGFGGPALHGILMGGGLGPDFLGRIPFGRFKGRG